nr:hypothetical protein [Tanacetum cinerariifolium]
MQEFWATAKLHHKSIRFKIDTKKSVLDLEAFREMLHISPRIPNQSFAELPSEEEILDFLRFLGHSHEIRYLTDVNVNKLYQPWRSFASVINKCLTGKGFSVDSFRLSQAQMLWGFYHRINIDFAYLIWEDFVYQVEHKNQKRSNEMNYPRFTKVIIDYFMTRKTSISRRNRINWHYVRDDALFSTIKVVSRHQKTQQYGAILPIELTNDEIRNKTIEEEDEYFDPNLGTPSEEESNDEEEQDLRISEEARIQEEEDVEELYRDFADAVSAIPGIVHQYMDQQMKEAVREVVQIQTDRLQDLLQRENDEFLRNIDENMKKVLKGLVKNQVKEQVSRILPQIEESVNATLEAEILIEKMEGNKSIQRFDEQQNLYKALVEAYEADKAILDTYGDSTILKRRREDDDQEGPFAGSDRGSKRQKEGGGHASASTPSEKATRSEGRTTKGTQS